jgi:hypothetical protein
VLHLNVFKWMLSEFEKGDSLAAGTEKSTIRRSILE